MQKDKKIHLTVASSSGDYEDDFNQNMQIHAVKTKAMAHLHIDPSQAANYVLTLEGNILNENATLLELQVPNDSVLILEPKEAVKI